VIAPASDGVTDDSAWLIERARRAGYFDGATNKQIDRIPENKILEPVASTWPGFTVAIRRTDNDEGASALRAGIRRFHELAETAQAKLDCLLARLAVGKDVIIGKWRRSPL
jgi:hypothetical protein